MTPVRLLLSALILCFAPLARAQEVFPDPVEVPNPAEVPPAPLVRTAGIGPAPGIVVRVTENTTGGGWVFILKQCKELGISRIDLLVKQDEDNFVSPRTGRTLQSGELLVALPGEKTAEGWENSDWLVEMLARAAEMNIEVWAWWPCFHDADAAQRFPAAAYRSQRNEVFVDPAVPGVRERQEELLGKLLKTYYFNGVSLDWVRYNAWSDGLGGPLMERFAREQGFRASADELKSDIWKARWFENRATLLADWVGSISRQMRTRFPRTRWGAFLEPEQFSELGINFALFGRSGIDFIQPMAYWKDFKKTAEWAGTTMRRHRSLTGGTSFWPTIGVDHPIAELERAIGSFPVDPMSGLSFFTFGSWEQKTFNHLRELLTKSRPTRLLLGYEVEAPVPAASAPLVVPTGIPSAKRAEPKAFSDESSIWSVVCLGELYRRRALEARNDDPVVPVLAFHTFIEAEGGSPAYAYKCSGAYLDALLDAISTAGFNVIPLSRLQSYLIAGDPAMLPAKPIVITTDDASDSVRTVLHPRMVQRKMPYTIAAVTSWLGETAENIRPTFEFGQPQATMTWQGLREVYESKLVEIVSHSDDLHYQTTEAPLVMEGTPAETTRQYLKEHERIETNNEYMRRIRLDMLTSRRKLEKFGFRPPTIFCWPYGDWTATTRSIAESTGFTHFLLFDHPGVFASRESAGVNIPRLPFMRADEKIPLRFPGDRAEAQSWWLAFLSQARLAMSEPLLKAALAQLAPENINHPQAEITRAALDFVRGNAGAGSDRLTRLRRLYPFDPVIGPAIDRTADQFQPKPK